MEESLPHSWPGDTADYSRAVEAMGTRFEVFLRGPDQEHLEAVAVAVVEEIYRLDQSLSRFDPRSEIARVNRAAARHDGPPARVDREVFALLERCERAREATEGYFDVTVGANVGENPQPALLLDPDSRRVQLTRPEAFVDLGGVGKGYALDRGGEIMRRFGVTSGLLQGGTSSVLAVGDEAWPIDLRHPRFAETVVGRVELNDRALSCSAARPRDGEPSDIVNPLTGARLTGHDACVVLAADATEAEVFSTALLAMEREQAARFLRGRAGLEVGWVRDDELRWYDRSEGDFK